MATLYLDRKGAALDIDAGSLTVRLGGALATRIPLVPLERVVLRGDAVLSTRVLAELWRHDIGLLLLSGRHTRRPRGWSAARTTMWRCAWRNTGGRATARRAG
jgi:CRISP-associated protein Cas1